ncbi:hypothetical protein [Nesterenkonia suensis]
MDDFWKKFDIDNAPVHDTAAELSQASIQAHLETRGFSYDEDGALMVSEQAVEAFVDEWRDELEWLAER